MGIRCRLFAKAGISRELLSNAGVQDRVRRAVCLTVSLVYPTFRGMFTASAPSAPALRAGESAPVGLGGGYGKIAGVITDPSGAAVAGAKLVARLYRR
jgi:hypothetical protein